MFKKAVMLFFCFMTHLVFSNPYKLTHPVYNPGFFSVFNTVLGALDFYEKSIKCDGLEVDFGDQGLFYDQNHGINWWEYYFEPICIGVKDAIQEKFPTYKKITFALSAEFEMSRSDGNNLIKKYIKLKPHVQDKLNAFVATHFEKNRIIGIHYRGTDKKSEAPAISYEEVTATIAKEAMQRDVKFFVATDDANFLKHMYKKFPEKIIATDAIRSKDEKPIHYPRSENMYQKGEDALLDCLLLAQCSKIYKMASNLSDTSMKFNPSIPITHLNTSYNENSENEKYNIFKTLNAVLALLQSYEGGKQEGAIIDLPIQGEKYVDKSGTNWWTFYFEPLSFGKCPQKTNIPSSLSTKLALTNLFEMPKEEASVLLKKYIQIKQNIREEVERFAQEQFEDASVLGIYYQKQHGICQDLLQPSVSHKTILNYVTQKTKSMQHRKYKVFVSTNDEELFNQLHQTFPNVIYYHRPTIEEQSDSEKEELELIDCLLLSKSHSAAGTSSELLKVAQQFNPKLSVEEFDTLWLEKI